MVQDPWNDLIDNLLDLNFINYRIQLFLDQNDRKQFAHLHEIMVKGPHLKMDSSILLSAQEGYRLAGFQLVLSKTIFSRLQTL